MVQCEFAFELGSKSGDDERPGELINYSRVMWLEA